MKTSQLILIIVFFSNSMIAIADGYTCGPLYNSFSRIEYFTKVKVIEKKLIENIDTCIKGKTIVHPTKYQYKCRLIENIYGNITDSIFSLTYSDPQFLEYDDSCNIIRSYWILTSCRGVEKVLNINDEVYLCFDHFHQIIAAIITLTEMDKFLINYLEELKKIDKYKLALDNSKAIGVNASNEFCQLRLTYESSIENYIPTVVVLHNREFTTYIGKPSRELSSIDSNFVWKFEITRKKIILYCKQKRYKLYIKK
jgi:hypothetical protein